VHWVKRVHNYKNNYFSIMLLYYQIAIALYKHVTSFVIFFTKISNIHKSLKQWRNITKKTWMDQIYLTSVTEIFIYLFVSTISFNVRVQYRKSGFISISPKSWQTWENWVPVLIYSIYIIQCMDKWSFNIFLSASWSDLW
jgi:predicted Zn-dependent protease